MINTNIEGVNTEDNNDTQFINELFGKQENNTEQSLVTLDSTRINYIVFVPIFSIVLDYIMSRNIYISISIWSITIISSIIVAILDERSLRKVGLSNPFLRLTSAVPPLYVLFRQRVTPKKLPSVVLVGVILLIAFFNARLTYAITATPDSFIEFVTTSQFDEQYTVTNVNTADVVDAYLNEKAEWKAFEEEGYYYVSAIGKYGENGKSIEIVFYVDWDGFTYYGNNISYINIDGEMISDKEFDKVYDEICKKSSVEIIDE